MNKYISIFVTAATSYTQYIIGSKVSLVQQDSVTSTTIYFTNAHSYVDAGTTDVTTGKVVITHADDSTANYPLKDAIMTAVLIVNAEGFADSSQMVEMPTIAGVPITVTAIVFS